MVASLILLILVIQCSIVTEIASEGLLDKVEIRDLGDSRQKNGSGGALFDISASIQKLPNILLKKQKKVKNSEKVTDQIKVDPPECIETTFLDPATTHIIFPDENKTAEIRNSTHCNWNYIGTDVCRPKLTCSKFKLPADCSQHYMLVVDGTSGAQKFCGSEGPQDIIASNHVRDLYILLNGTSNVDFELNCTISCAKGGEGTPLTDTFQKKVLPNCLCGQKPGSDRIVNGYLGKKSEFPWLVAVVEAKTRQPFCGASIINDRFILTAAHCFKGKYMDYRRVQLLLKAEILDIMPNSGVAQVKPQPKTYKPDELQKLDSGNDTIRLDIDEIFIHPLYVSETNDFDVAVVRTVQKINITVKELNPICLPPLGAYGLSFAHKSAIVAGWGLPSAEAPGTNTQLNKLNVTVFSQKICKEYYAHRVNRRMMCAGYKEGGKDSCMGDSGGPLMHESEQKVWTQIGTVSWGEGCAVAENPGVYYRLTEIGQWANYVSNLRGASWCDLPAVLKNQF